MLEVLDRVRAGALSPDEAARLVGELPYAEVAHAVGSSTIDHHRELRTGIPEIVYGQSKTGEQILERFETLVRQGKTVVIVTHDPTVAHRCERVIHLHDGIVQKDERHARHPVSVEGGQLSAEFVDEA